MATGSHAGLNPASSEWMMCGAALATGAPVGHRRSAMRVQLPDDEATEVLLEAALVELGAVVELADWSVVGAIETSVYRVELAVGRLELVARSFEGTVLSGDRAAVQALQRALGLPRPSPH